MLIGKFRLFWSKSVTPNIVSVTVDSVVNGVTAHAVVSPDVEEYVVDIAANSNAAFTVTSTNADGLSSVSAVHSFVVDSLENPQPATGLGHSLLSVIDTEATTTQPPISPVPKPGVK